MNKEIKTYQFIPEFQNRSNKSILKSITKAGTWPDTECMNLQGFSDITKGMPVYAIVDNGEVVIILLDWRKDPKQEVANEEAPRGLHPVYISDGKKRLSPVNILSDFTSQYKKALTDAGIELPKIWSVLISNSTFSNYKEMQDVWEKMCISVYHGFGYGPIPEVHYSYKFHHEALAYYKAFRLWCERQGFLPRDPYAFDGIDAEYDEMEFGLDEDDNDIDVDKDDEYDDYDGFDKSILKLFEDADKIYESLGREEDEDSIDEEKMELPFPVEMEESIVDSMIISRDETRSFTDDISEIDIEIMAGYEEGHYNSGTASVTFTGKHGVNLIQNRFLCNIYNDSYYPMCYICEDAAVERKEGDKLTIEMTCEHIWVPGKYILIIRDDERAWIVRKDFELDDNLHVSCSPFQICDLFGIEGTLITSMPFIDWNVISTIPGNSQMRKKAIELQQIILYNSFRAEHGGQKMKTFGNFVFYTNTNDITPIILYHFSNLTGFEQEFKHIDCAQLFDVSRTNPYELLPEQLLDAEDKILCLTNLGELLGSSGKVIMKKLISMVRNGSDRTLLWLCGTKRDIDDLMNLFPSLRQFFHKDCYLEQEPYTAFELVQAVFRELVKEDMFAPVSVKDLLVRAIIQGHEKGTLVNWSLEDVKKFVTEDIRPRYIQRTIPMMIDDDVPMLEEGDIDMSKLVTSSSSFKECIQELDDMVGLEDVKRGIMTMANQARLFVERRRRGLKTSSGMMFHSIFTGNPGTGKTTVARKLGKIYHSLGLLSKGEVISVDRTRLVGQYIGQTEENMKIVLEEARGNVLFVDEAYTLNVGSYDDRKDFGGRVLDSLLTVLTQPDPDMLIVFAGYTKEMDAMLNTNPGLAGRFPFRYSFEDYSAEELMAIARKLLEKDEYNLTKDADTELQKAISETIRQKVKNFGNARWVEQFVQNGIIPAMADRIFSTDSEDFQHIEVSDVQKAYEKFNPKSIELKPRHRVTGFSS